MAATLGPVNEQIIASTANATSTFNHTVAPGTNFVVVRISAQAHSSGDAAPSGVTLNGVALTSAVAEKASIDIAQIWYLPAALVPPAGTYSVVISWATGGIAGAVVAVQNGSGFHNTPFRGNANTSGGSATSSSINVSSAVGDIVLDAIKLRASRTPGSHSFATGANQTIDYYRNGNDGPTTATFAGSSEAGAETQTTMSWSWTAGTSLVHVGASFIPGDDEPPGPPGEVTATLGFHTDGTQKVDVSFSPENSTDDYAIMRRPVTDPESEFVLIGVMDATSDDPAVWTDHAIHDMPAGQYEYTVQRIISEGTYGTPYTSDIVETIIGGGSVAVIVVSAFGGGSALTEEGELRGFVQDTATDDDATSLADHIGEVGADWSLVLGDGEAQILSNRIANLCDSNEQAVYVASGDPGSADYSFAVDLVVHSDLSHYAGPCVRMDPNDAFGTYIVGRRKQNNGTWQIIEYDSGNATVIASVAEEFEGFARVKLAVQGSTVVLTVNDVVKCQGTTSLLFAGRPGLQIGTNSGGSAGTATTGITIDNLEAIVDDGEEIPDPPIFSGGSGSRGFVMAIILYGAPIGLEGDAN